MMAHYAKVENGIVATVVVVPDSHESDGQAFLADTLGLGGTWLQTSYNTHGNQHPEGRPLRYNYAAPGFTYDSVRDAFIPPQPDGDGWVLDESTCLWVQA